MSTRTVVFCAAASVAIVCGALAAGPPDRAAEGFGADSVGGEGGEVIWVTNLNDSGPGSFREAVTGEGPRIVKFKVGGIINLSESVAVQHGRLTIDGASAAEHGGLTLHGHGLVLWGLGCSDVIVRHIRVRRASPGDCIGVAAGAHRVLIDHCSVSWADDENFGINKGHYVTVQWCIIAEGLIEGAHAKGAHSCGMLVAHGANHVSVHHNFFAGNQNRNALLYGVGGIGSGGVMPGTYPGEEMAIFMPTAVFDFRNNLVYNFILGTQLGEGVHANVVGNSYRNAEGVGDCRPVAIDTKIFYPGSEQPKVYCQGNVGPQRPRDEGEEWALVSVAGRWGSDPAHRSDRPFLTPPVVTQRADDIAALILENAGAHPRDEVDRRLVEEFRAGKGAIGRGYLDWKSQHGL